MMKDEADDQIFGEISWSEIQRTLVFISRLEFWSNILLHLTCEKTIGFEEYGIFEFKGY
jgi:hypothetical protein